MDSSIRRTLWGAFAALTALVTVGLALTLTTLQIGKRQEYVYAHGARPLIRATRTMDTELELMVSSSRGFLLTQQGQFLAQYDDSAREFDRAAALTAQYTTDPADIQLVSQFRSHEASVRSLLEKQIALCRAGRQSDASQLMLDTDRLRRSAPDYAGMIEDNHRRDQALQLDKTASMRLGLSMTMVIVSILIVLLAAILVQRIDRSLFSSIDRQVKRTEAMIGSMMDGVMIVDRAGKSLFMNPAARQLLGCADVNVPLFKQAETYHLRSESGVQIEPDALPVSLALSSGHPVTETTMLIAREDHSVAISMSATPLHDGTVNAGAIVTFRDITARRRLEEEMQLQAERAQILADAGAFFSSNIDPVFVTQAIAERVAQVLGDWAAVILVAPDTTEMRVASIHHRDPSQLGMAWSYIYRQAMVVGEGLIGQVVSTGYPSLTSNVGNRVEGISMQSGTGVEPAPMKLASLLVLPLRTRQEMLGALVIAATDPSRQMTDDQLPLAEVLAERGALAIENAKLYKDQVEARRKVEDLSRLKDEFLSIASHELRTPVTSIKGYTQLAKTLIKEGDLETSEEYLNIALDQIDRMSRLILELLDVSRIETGRLEIRRDEIDWGTFVRDVVHRHHTAVSDRRFHLDVPDDSPPVTGDRDRLEQVLGNLLENAVKYSPDGSEIMVRAEMKDGRIVTSVCDRGIGIPSDEVARVFERFHRGRQVSSTNYGGLGLGLYISKQIVERHGGAIWVESKEGSGTTFYFSLPVAAAIANRGEVQLAPQAT